MARPALSYLLPLVTALALAPFPRASVAQLVPGPGEGYLIVTTQALAPEFEALADWKRRIGLPATVKTLEALQVEYAAAADDAERIRLWIRDRYTGPGARWVLLGGSASVVPTRFATTQFFGGQFVPTDLYFACLDGSWNEDGDALWGEGYLDSSNPGDGADLVPEVWVGRAPVTTPAEAHDFVERSIRASIEPITPRAPRALVAAEVLFPMAWTLGDDISLDGAELAEPLLPTLGAGGVATRRLYENYADPQYVPGSEPLGRTAFLDAFADGHDLVLVFDHESLDALSMGGTDSVRIPDIEALANVEPLSHVYLWGGEGPLGPSSPIGPAFFHAPGGAATVVGLTHYAFPTALRYYAQEYFRLLLEDEVRALGETLGRSRLPFIQFSEADGVHRWTQMTLALFGDPQLALPRHAGAALALDAPASIIVGSEGIAVHVTEDGAPRAGAIVTAYREAEGIATATTDAAGDALVPFAPGTPGAVSLTARVTGIPLDVASVEAIESTTGIDAGPGPLRVAFATPRPNPSAGEVQLVWSVPQGVEDAGARLSIHDLAGRTVRTWSPAPRGAGTHSLRWDGRDAGGAVVATGLYVATLEVGGQRLARPVLVAR